MSIEHGIYGPVHGLVVGDHNRVEIVLPAGESVPFMAPPRPAHDLVGRTELLDALRRDVVAGHDSTLFALKGIPGVGKTALAIALAHDPRVGGTFVGGVLWAGLGPTPDIMTLLANWGAALGIPAEQLAKAASPQARAQIVHLAIGLRRMLLIVDDAWSTEAALTFRLGGPNCVHVLTTRIPRSRRASRRRPSTSRNFSGTRVRSCSPASRPRPPRPTPTAYAISSTSSPVCRSP